MLLKGPRGKSLRVLVVAKVSNSLADFLLCPYMERNVPESVPDFLHPPSPHSATMVPDCCKKKSVGFLRTRKYFILFVRNSDRIGLAACTYSTVYRTVPWIIFTELELDWGYQRSASGQGTLGFSIVGKNTQKLASVQSSLQYGE